MFIQTEATPNPASLKFLPGREVLAGGGMDFPDAAAAEASPLASALFAVGGVERVFLGPDFLSVTKAAHADWATLKPLTLAAIMDHFVAGAPVLAAPRAAPGPEATVYDGPTAQIVAEIEELLETRVRPAVAADGGDIVFDRFDPERGIVHLHMQGACSGCPSSSMTLKAGVENLLKHYVPEVKGVEASG